MTTYVDDMFKHPMGAFGRMRMSHMIADTEAELHDMAAKIGLARRWFQGDHYDVSMALRAKAVAAGAIEITLRQSGCMMSVRRRGLPLPAPEAARAALREFNVLTEIDEEIAEEEKVE